MSANRPEQTGAAPRRRFLERATVLTGLLADAAGHLAAGLMLLLTAGIALLILLRLLHIDNSWVYDLTIFTLVWTAFIGAVLTAYRDKHVTAGIALENIFGRGIVLSLIRFVIVAGFLVLLLISSAQQWHSSFVDNETTLDVVQWHTWVAKVALPISAALWLIAELHKLLRRLTRKDN
jgi:TRAP-type C4-dicarboxylate transport system permease small subunit